MKRVRFVTRRVERIAYEAVVPDETTEGHVLSAGGDEWDALLEGADADFLDEDEEVEPGSYRVLEEGL